MGHGNPQPLITWQRQDGAQIQVQYRSWSVWPTGTHSHSSPGRDRMGHWYRVSLNHDVGEGFRVDVELGWTWVSLNHDEGEGIRVDLELG